MMRGRWDNGIAGTVSLGVKAFVEDILATSSSQLLLITGYSPDIFEYET